MASESLDTSEDKNKREQILARKKQVVQKLIERFEERLSGLTSSRDTTRKLAIDSPGANQSHSDTSKFQLANVQLGLESVRLDIEKTISQLRQMPINGCTKISIGAIFTIREVDSKEPEKRYFLVSMGGGETLELDDLSLTSIAPNAPIARACLQKTKEDTFKFQNKEFEIINIV
jgi:hypothetical protein